ncbi:hypothetical protein GGTG_06565 [Gaeumannomyces tritici R3-111a-1]|uniref:Uncharacterized protein n=1 Tax=Gaeumannomyces tritici (strain R3-111a-1) TaxID=644352 RepID=J3NZ65_GAET3|nr:hypothetical protein GGTG_06565 [Gaeumannomyces tritici R3-111a-1]EJT76648.1 hypothetical protein GGTG_06565 [Gaeumannomyces tritici R3-111a-1]
MYFLVALAGFSNCNMPESDWGKVTPVSPKATSDPTPKVQPAQEAQPEQSAEFAVMVPQLMSVYDAIDYCRAYGCYKEGNRVWYLEELTYFV